MAAEAAPGAPMTAEELSKRIFIRGFDFGTTEEQVKAHCASAGEILSCEKQSNNAMILTYSSAAEAEKAVATLNQTVVEGNTRYIDVKLDEGKETGKEKKPKEPAGPSGPELPRQRVSESPIPGMVLRYVGNTGWIKPSETVDHPELGRHKGKIYVHKKDLQGVESLQKDSSVVFHLYSDGAGLGAEEVTVVALPPPPAEKPVVKGPPPTSPPPAAPGTVAEGSADAKPGEAQTAEAKSGSKKKKKKNKGKKGGSSKGSKTWKEPKGPSGPDLDRQRIGESPISGTVLRFVGNTGWITPSENIEHPEFAKHKGKVYVHKKDLQGLDSLEKDMKVIFHLYGDSCGLGAEEVTLAL